MAALEAFTQKTFTGLNKRVGMAEFCVQNRHLLTRLLPKKYHFISRMFLIGETITEFEVFTSKHFYTDSISVSGSFANICSLYVSNVR